MCQCWKALPISQRLIIIGVVFLILAPVFLLTSFLFPLTADDLVESGLDEKLIMKDKNSEFYKKVWSDNSKNNPDAIPQYKNIYVFNITNVEEVYQGGNIKVEQIGPFVYRYNKVRYQDDITGELVSYKTWEYYTFERSLSVLDAMTAEVYMPNLGVIAVASKLPGGMIPKIIASLALAGLSIEPFYKKTVNEFVWGWESPVLRAIHRLVSSVPSIVPGPVVNQTSKQDSTDKLPGVSVINNGVKDLNKIFTYSKWNGMSAIEGIWASPENITGTEGIAFHRDMKKTDFLVGFLPEVKRVLTMDYVGERTFRGIKLYRYSPSASIFYNDKQKPENAKYYQYGPSGVLNISSVFEGVPLFMSRPHFLGADPVYLKQIEGLSPNSDDHESAIDVEPISGITMFARKRLQVNVKLSQVSYFPHFSHLPEVLCPFVWIEDAGEVSEKVANEFKSTVYVAKKGKVVIRWSAIGAFVVFMIISLTLFFFAFKKRNLGAGNEYDYVDLNAANRQKDESAFGEKRMSLMS